MSKLWIFLAIYFSVIPSLSALGPGSSLDSNHNLMIYFDDRLDANYVNSKVQISVSRLEKFTYTRWRYDLKPVSSVFSSWNIDEVWRGFFVDLWEQTNFEQDYREHDIIVYISSANIGGTGFYSITFGKSFLDSISNEPYGGAVLEHEIFHLFGLEDRDFASGSRDGLECIMSSYRTDAFNSFDLCDQVDSVLGLQTVDYATYIDRKGLAGKVFVSTNLRFPDYLYKKFEIDRGNEWQRIFVTSEIPNCCVLPGLRTVRYDGMTTTVAILPTHTSSVYLNYPVPVVSTTPPPTPPPISGGSSSIFAVWIASFFRAVLTIFGFVIGPAVVAVIGYVIIKKIIIDWLWEKIR